jgi:dihydroorotate dehydrogenase electron transfer subunit
VLPVQNEDGTTSMLRSCIDGPVMDGSVVRWDLVGKVPEAQQ